MQKEEKHVIWSNNASEIYAIAKDWRDEHDEGNVEDYFEEAEKICTEYLEDERANLNIITDTPIVCIAELGRWDGKRKAFKEIGSNISKCLYSECDVCTWYVDENKDFRCIAEHHDGVNKYLYRRWKLNITETQKDAFISLVLSGECTGHHIASYTLCLGDEIGKVYGWKFANKKKEKTL